MGFFSGLESLIQRVINIDTNREYSRRAVDTGIAAGATALLLSSLPFEASAASKPASSTSDTEDTFKSLLVPTKDSSFFGYDEIGQKFYDNIEVLRDKHGDVTGYKTEDKRIITNLEEGLVFREVEKDAYVTITNLFDTGELVIWESPYLEDTIELRNRKRDKQKPGKLGSAVNGEKYDVLGISINNPNEIWLEVLIKEEDGEKKTGFIHARRTIDGKVRDYFKPDKRKGKEAEDEDLSGGTYKPTAVRTLQKLPEIRAPKYTLDRLLTNEDFVNSGSMTEQEIQRFLHRNGSILADYRRKNGEKTSHAIYEAAQKYGINPMLLLVKLEVEQSLISAKKASSWRLDWALGFGATDRGRIRDYRGFEKQIEASARRLRIMYNKASTLNYPYTRTNINYGGRYGGPTSISLKNAATKVLYDYTPHTRDYKLKVVGGGNYLFLNIWARYTQDINKMRKAS